MVHSNSVAIKSDFGGTVLLGLILPYSAPRGNNSYCLVALSRMVLDTPGVYQKGQGVFRGVTPKIFLKSLPSPLAH